MTPPDETTNSAGTSAALHTWPRITLRFGLSLAALLICFGWPLCDLLLFSLQSGLYSHIVLIPVISAYLAWKQRPALPLPSAPSRRFAAGLVAGGVLVWGGYWTARLAGTKLAHEDSLALLIFAFLLFFAGICAWFLGRATLRVFGFPLGLLIFMVPFPTIVTSGMEAFLQYTSAASAHVLFKLTGTPVFYHDLIFRLPGINLEVAPECSGIHSSLALFITSLLAGHLFLKSPWKKTVLALAVIPLGILRNGVRIYTIGELCVQISPDMIDSYIHHHGGPVFFALSLVPFLLLLHYLYKSEYPAK